MPAEFVVETLLTPVCTFVRVTCTPNITAPELSVTVPLISPVLAFCPRAKVPMEAITNEQLILLHIFRWLVLMAHPPDSTHIGIWTRAIAEASESIRKPA